MNRKNFSVLFFVLFLLNPVINIAMLPGTVAASNVNQIDGPPYYDWTFSINSSKNGLVTWTAAEFMALPNLTGWGQQIGRTEPAKYTGINFTWLMVNYGDWGNGVIYKIIETTGFLAT